MKNFTALFLILCFTSSLAYSNTKRPMRKQSKGVFVIDDFEDGDIGRYPEWWKFGDVLVSTEINNQNELDGLEVKSLRTLGSSSDWYIGGLGAYIGVDTRPYNAIKLVVRGIGETSGTVMIELYDDDNNNWEIEPHSQDPSLTYADDKFVYTLKVNWIGWKVIIIPFNRFVDGNKRIGDDIWNPYQRNGSGGLLQMQLILLSHQKEGRADIQFDTIKLFKYVKPTKKVQSDEFF